MLRAMAVSDQSQTLPEVSLESTQPPEAQAATVVLTYLTATQLASKNVAFGVLSELASQTIERTSKGQPTDITALNLKSGVAPDVLRDPSGWLSPHWKKLVKEEPTWQEPMESIARRDGHDYVPKLEKLPGNPAHYRLCPVRLPEPTISDQAVQQRASAPPGGVCYEREGVMAPGWFLSNALRSGTVPWNAGVRWTLALGVMAGVIGVLGLLSMFFMLGQKINRPIYPSDVATSLAFLAIAVAVVSVFRFFSDLFDLRIVMAPSLLVPWSADNVTLELRPSTSEDKAQLAFVKYSSTCPICGGKVELFGGGREFIGRIVGRCRRSPREHVFSFDHVSRIGHPLR